MIKIGEIKVQNLGIATSFSSFFWYPYWEFQRFLGLSVSAALK